MRVKALLRFLKKKRKKKAQLVTISGKGGRRRKNSGCFLSVHASLCCSSPPPSTLSACVRVEPLREWVSRLTLLSPLTGSSSVTGGRKQPLDLSLSVCVCPYPHPCRCSGTCQRRTKLREGLDAGRMSGRVLNGKALQLPAPQQRAGRTMHFLSR